MSLRIVFMGTPEFSVPTLTSLIGQGHEIVAVYTRAPTKAGRGMDLRKSPVQQTAETFGIPVLTPKTFRDEAVQAEFAAMQADVAVVVAYGLILPQAALDTPQFGCLNLHGSLLPRWRGAAPINRVIMAGDAQTGVEVMRMEAGLDTGPVAMAEILALGESETAGELHDRMAVIGADLMVRAVAALARGSLRFTPQSEEGVTYAAKIEKTETRIDWSRPAREIHNHIRGLSPFPGAWFEADLGKGPERVKVLRSVFVQADGAPGEVLDEQGAIAGAGGSVRLIEVQRAGAKPLSFQEFARGAKLSIGTVLV